MIVAMIIPSLRSQCCHEALHDSLPIESMDI
jgi:hypothetical protein